MGTKYGLVRFWWVAIKLVLTIVRTTLIAVALRPEVVDVAVASRDVLSGGDVTVAAGDLIYPPAVSLTALVIAVVLSVVKPWGRVRRRDPAVRR